MTRTGLGVTGLLKAAQVTTDYFFDNTWPEERARIAALEAALDPGTRELLTARGPRPGWRCLEVGAGGGSVAAWLAEHDGVEVLATDIQTSFIEPMAHSSLTVQSHDVTQGDPPVRGPHDRHALPADHGGLGPTPEMRQRGR